MPTTNSCIIKSETCLVQSHDYGFMTPCMIGLLDIAKLMFSYEKVMNYMF